MEDKKKIKRLSLRKVVVIVLLLTLYSNVGWIVGSYYFHNIVSVERENLTNFGKVMAGGWASFSQPDIEHSVFFSAVFPGIIWPIILIIVAGSWIIYFIYYGIYYAIYYALVHLCRRGRQVVRACIVTRPL